MLLEHGIDVHLLMVIKPLYCQPEACVRVNDKQSKSFHVGVGLRRGGVLRFLVFVICMNLMNKLCQTDECVTIGRCKISQLFFADDLVLLASSESGLQRPSNGFAAACDISGMKISTFKIEVLHLLRNFVQCFQRVGGISLKQEKKFKYLRVAFTNDGRQDEKLVFDQANQVLYCELRTIQSS